MTAFLAFVLFITADERVDRLPDQHRDWIEKQVLYIIADKEREMFLDLEDLESAEYEELRVDRHQRHVSEWSWPAVHRLRADRPES